MIPAKQFSIAMLLVLATGICTSELYAQTQGTKSQLLTMSGYINRKIPVFMWLRVNADSMVQGELIYTGTKKHEPINLSGWCGDKCELSELDKLGNATGSWEGVIAADHYKGTWYSTKHNKELSFDLKKKDTTLPANITSTEPENIDGTYVYEFPNHSGGEVNVRKLGKDRVIFNVSCITPSPAYNVAQISDDTLALSQNKANYRLVTDEYQCVFTIIFYKKFLVISYDCLECTQCGFGLNAGVSGDFIKISSKPKMGLNSR